MLSVLDKKTKNQNHSVKVTQLLIISEVYDLSTPHPSPHCQGLHGRINADSKESPYVASVLEPSVPLSSECMLLLI